MATEVDNVNSGALGTLLSVGAFSTLGIALVVTALVRSEMSDEAEKKEVGADRSFRDLVAEQTAKLSAPAAYVDRGKGLVSLPIERAMELVVSGLKKDPNSATPPAPKDAKPEDAAAPAPSNSGDTQPQAAPAPEGTVPAPGAALPPQDAAADGEKKDGEKKDGEKKDKDKEKKDAPKPKPAAAAPVPKAPAPAVPPPAAPAPNGQ